MTSVITSLFSSSSKQTTIAGYVDVMRRAESSLMAYARQFAPVPHRADDDFSMELIDTHIPKRVVPLKNPNEKCQWKMSSTCPNDNNNEDEDDDNLIIHSIKVTSKEHTSKEEEEDSSDKPPIVLLHGYMNGALYFYRNLLGLASLTSKVSSAVHALDLLGWGLSSRPKFVLNNDTTETAEQFFVESLEAWRKQQNIPKMILGGHSMGGYISIAYAEKYPSRVERLILLSPAGVPREDDETEFEQRKKKFPFTTRLFLSTAGMMWNYGITPSGFIRSLPSSKGRLSVSRYIERRLPAITDQEEREQLTDYLYTNCILPGSGEDCLNRFLKPMAFAKHPAVDRIPHLKVKNISFIYGQMDWMNPDGGFEAQRLCASQDNDAPNVNVLGVKNAGHLLMLENWQEFNAAVAIAAGCNDIPNTIPKPIIFTTAPTTNNNSQTFFVKPRFQKERDYENNDESEKKKKNNETTTTVTPSPAMD